MTDHPEVFALTSQERHSALWAKLLSHFNEKLAINRAKNDGPHDATVTATLRGQNAVYRDLISLDREPVRDQ